MLPEPEAPFDPDQIEPMVLPSALKALCPEGMPCACEIAWQQQNERVTTAGELSVTHEALYRTISTLAESVCLQIVNRL